MGNNVITFFPDIGTWTILDQLSDQYVHRFDEPWTNRSDATKTYRCYVKGILNIHTIPSYIHAAWTFDKKWNQTTGSPRLQLKQPFTLWRRGLQGFWQLLITGQTSRLIWKSVQTQHNSLAVMKSTWQNRRYQGFIMNTIEAQQGCFKSLNAVWAGDFL